MIIFSDVDGVLTDGFFYHNEKSDLIKAFSTRDFHAINAVSLEGFKFIFLTASSDWCTRTKFNSYDLMLLSGCKNKKSAVIQLCSQFNCSPSDCIFIGDGPQDVLAMMLCGRRFCPNNSAQLMYETENVQRLDSVGGGGVIDEMLYKVFPEEYKRILLK